MKANKQCRDSCAEKVVKRDKAMRTHRGGEGERKKKVGGVGVVRDVVNGPIPRCGG